MLNINRKLNTDSLKRYIPALIIGLSIFTINFVSAFLRNLDLPENIANIINISLIAMPFLIFYFLVKFFPRLFMIRPFAHMELLFRKGEYDKLIPMVENALEEDKARHTVQLAAAAYMQVGRFDDAEKLIREALSVMEVGLVKLDEKTERMVRNEQFGLLALIQIMAGKLDEAGEILQKISGVHEIKYNVLNTFTEYYLYTGQHEQAMLHIHHTEKSYQDEHQPVSAYTRALKAWAFAQQGKAEEADALIADAIQQTPSEHVADLAEIYYFAGLSATAQGKTDAARKAFEKAYELDPRGIHGILSKQQL